MPFLAGPWRFVWHYVAAKPYMFLALAMVVVGASSSAIYVQYSMKLLIDAMTAKPSVMDHVYGALAIFIGMTLLESLLQRVAAFTLSSVTVQSGVNIRLDMFNYLTGHQLPFFQNHRAGALGHRVSTLSGSFGSVIHRLFLEIAPPLIAFTGAIIIFVSIDVRMSIALSLVFLIVTGALVVLGFRGHVHHQDFAGRAGVVGGELVDLISNIWVVKAFAARRREAERLRGFLLEEAAAQRRGWFFVERIRGLHDFALALLVGGTLLWTIGRWSAGLITTGDVVVVSTLTFRILQGSRDLAMAVIDTSQQCSYLRETLDVIGLPQTLNDRPNAKPLTVRDGTVRFENVTFGYTDDSAILHGLSIDVPAGQKVGLVGPSGAGKSSILQLIQRFYDPQSGDVLIDGQCVAAVTQDSLHEAIAVVPQEVMLFHRTVMENIRFARPGASDADVRRAAEAAGCDGFIMQLPDGYDSIVGERGTNLSGGQRQRIGIARAFLKDARLVLLDEATSALDTGSEMEVQSGLNALMTDRTVIAVAHRLSTIAAFDRVLVLEEGRVLEDGAPQDLLAQPDGLFRKLWQLQADGLIQSDVVLPDTPCPPLAPPRPTELAAPL
ncbi:ABC transporter ATP-binding protein [Sphingomonas prati]|uniref:ATP-binding cassette subfamily B protein n=1 Tax=Sphingomonas prati TaxID=1843237 RepID=A0A7W9F2Z8_9SPHN|nr:ABC transporter ATP-binding protein [Sphingomonas prati]MBB5729334.1 ATP-binding cassette subfamily B protein [Sphingomonas prati]GGE78273.1 ABC transporter ATP-binding protein [Sphingomonas prati]